MKIIFVCTRSITFNSFLKSQADYFIKKGFKVEVACSDNENLEFNKFVNHKISFPFKIIELLNIISILKIKQNNKNNLARFSSKVKNIDLIDNFYVQQLNKDFVIVKIKYLGKIDKIIKKLKYEKIFLKMSEGQWQLSLT